MKRYLPSKLGGNPDNVWNHLLAPLHDRLTKSFSDPMFSLIGKIKPAPRKIMEIGVARGLSAKLMIKAAQKAGATEVEFYGFDIFEISERE